MNDNELVTSQNMRYDRNQTFTWGNHTVHHSHGTMVATQLFCTMHMHFLCPGHTDIYYMSVCLMKVQRELHENFQRKTEIYMSLIWIYVRGQKPNDDGTSASARSAGDKGICSFWALFASSMCFLRFQTHSLLLLSAEQRSRRRIPFAPAG